MSSIQKSIHQIAALEELSHRETALNKIAPSIKIIITFIYIVAVVSFRTTDITGLIIFASFPVFFMLIGEIPIKPLFFRCMVALPFTFFAGISNLILDRTVIFNIGKFSVTKGMVTFTTLLLKTILTVMAVLILVAATSMNDIIYALIGMHVPSLIVIQIMMIYRYMSVLLREASLMYHAYLLRAPKEKGIRLVDMGSFLGQLILRSIDRAERIYQSMLCRGFEGGIAFAKRKVPVIKNCLIIILASIVIVFFRVVNIGEIIGRLIMMT